MNKTKMFFVALFATAFSVFSVSALAQPVINKINNSASIGLSGSLFNYQEAVPPADGVSDSESGFMPGFDVNLNVMQNLFGVKNVYFHADNRYNSGTVAYKGGVGFKPYNTTDSATTETFGFRIGKGFATFHRKFMFTPYVGVGYYAWNRALQGPYGYTENYSNGYASVGLLTQYAFTKHLVISGVTSMGLVYGGSLTAHVHGQALKSSAFKTTGRERLSANIDYLFTRHLYTYAGVSYTHFNYSGAPIPSVPGAFEPSSATNRFGIHVGLGFSF
jgi:hypothetical protein